MHDDDSMEPDDDLAGDDGKDDDMSNVFHGAHAHMHSIPHNPHQMGQPVPGQPLANTTFCMHAAMPWSASMNAFYSGMLHYWQCLSQ